jgi:hypothetical protein
MKTQQFQDLIQAITGRPLTFKIQTEEIPLDSVVMVFRPWKPGETTLAFTWKTPKKEDSLLRSFITTFCTKYREPDPDTYEGQSWQRYAEKWDDPATHWTGSPWHHHATHQVSKGKLRKQVADNFASFDSTMARLGFYATEYGIGIFTLYGGEWVRNSLVEMSNYLAENGLPYRNELSDAGWVTRFILKLDKPTHTKILGSF